MLRAGSKWIRSFQPRVTSDLVKCNRFVRNGTVVGGVMCAGGMYYTRESFVENRNTNRTILYSIIGLNTAVFLGFRASVVRPGLASFLSRHFLGSMKNLQEGRYHTLLTSTFSHYSFTHYTLNTLGTYIVLSEACKIFTPSQFVGLYCGAGIASSLAEIAFLYYFGVPTVVLGASGSLLAFIGYLATKFPHAEWSIIFIPYYFSSVTLIKGLIAFDIGGTLLYILNQQGITKFSSKIGHRAHFTGLTIGILTHEYLKKS